MDPGGATGRLQFTSRTFSIDAEPAEIATGVIGPAVGVDSASSSTRMSSKETSDMVWLPVVDCTMMPRRAWSTSVRRKRTSL